MLHWASYIGLSFSKEDNSYITKNAKYILKEYDNHIAWHDAQYLHLTLHYIGWLRDHEVKIVAEQLDITNNIVLVGFGPIPQDYLT